MDVNATVMCKKIAADVLLLVLSEMEYLREDFGSHERLLIRQAIEKSFTPFYQRIGKAASFFALKNMNNVKLVLKEKGVGFLRCADNLDRVIKRFSNNFFLSIDSVPKQSFPVVLLMFCGLIGAIAYCCNALEGTHLVEVCCNNLGEDLRSCFEDLGDAGGLQSLYDAAEESAVEYDSQYLKNETYVAEDLKDLY